MLALLARIFFLSRNVKLSLVLFLPKSFCSLHNHFKLLVLNQTDIYKNIVFKIQWGTKYRIDLDFRFNLYHMRFDYTLFKLSSMRRKKLRKETILGTLVIKILLPILQKCNVMKPVGVLCGNLGPAHILFWHMPNHCN